jgi:tRNA pseudouridine38-40 synthase
MGLPLGVTRYRAQVEYDGTNYCGFQRQRDGFLTIQGELERVLTNLAQQSVSITGAGRTDSGVHALGQVISFTIEWRHDASALQRAMNANLPEDIVVKHLQETAESFHPRFDARRRSYLYRVYNEPVRSPLYRGRSWHVARRLDLGEMNEAAASLIGRKDFATFGLPPQGESTEREVFSAVWHAEAQFLVFQIEANAFLYRMVRSLVGSLVAVGSGAWTVDDFIAAFQAKDRSRSAAAAPPQGLFLASITYKD